MDFAGNLKKLRKQKKISQEKLGAILGYYPSAIANYESGRNIPSMENLIKLASVLEVSLDELVGFVSKTEQMEQEERLSEESEPKAELTEQEQKLLEDFRNLKEEEQKIVLKLIHTLRS